MWIEEMYLGHSSKSLFYLLSITFDPDSLKCQQHSSVERGGDLAKKTMNKFWIPHPSQTKMPVGFVLCKGEPIQSSSVQIYHPELYLEILNDTNLTLILEVKYVLIDFSPVEHHKNQLEG